MYEFFSKRPKQIEDIIINRWERSRVHEDVFTLDETKRLIEIFKKAPKAGAGLTFYKMFDDCLNSDDFENTFKKPRNFTGFFRFACLINILQILDP